MHPEIAKVLKDLVLGLLLWNVVYKRIPISLVPKEVIIFGFVDDLATVIVTN